MFRSLPGVPRWLPAVAVVLMVAVGLLFAQGRRTGAKIMSLLNNMDSKDIRNEVKLFVDQRDDLRVLYAHPPGPVIIVVGGKRSFVQGLRIRRSQGSGGLRLRFEGLPDLRITFPK